ncbi:MAG: hypothetical protein Q8M76_00185 [Spirochaetaceae bacterium]|nr:hypothetical protein [Spirochaetaceae bacterium]
MSGRLQWSRGRLRAAIDAAIGVGLHETVGAEPPELPELASAFSGEGGKLFLVLDDFQAIRSTETRELCARFIDMLPGDAMGEGETRAALAMAMSEALAQTPERSDPAARDAARSHLRRGRL